jgi:hypothetical protein
MYILKSILLLFKPKLVRLKPLNYVSLGTQFLYVSLIHLIKYVNIVEKWRFLSLNIYITANLKLYLSSKYLKYNMTLN